MQRSLWLVAFVALGMFGAVEPLAAKYEVYVSIAGVSGECTKPPYRNWIKARTFTFEARKTTGASNTFTITKPIDATSPKLGEMAIRRAVIPSVKVDLTKDRPTHSAYVTFEMKQVRVETITFKATGTAVGLVPGEEVTLSFKEIKITHHTSKGNVEASWNLESVRKRGSSTRRPRGR